MPSFGENETKTFGQMEGRPTNEQVTDRVLDAMGVPREPERHVSGPAGVCICGQPAGRDPECPTHGYGPTTPEGATRVRDAMIALADAGNEPPAGTGVISTGASGVVGQEIPPLPPLGSSARVENPMPIDATPEVPGIADFEIKEASQADLAGSPRRWVDDEIVPMVRAAVMQHSRGEKVRWQAVPVPTPDNQGNITMGWMLFISVPGLVLDTVISGCDIEQTVVGWDQNAVNALVQRMLDACFGQRAGQVEQMRTAQAQARTAGPPPGMRPSGLIVPGL